MSLCGAVAKERIYRGFTRLGSSVATLKHYSAGAAELAGGVHGALQAELGEPDPEYI